MKVLVRRKHIREGNPNDAKRCPIALALREMGFSDPAVNHQDIEFSRQLKAELPGVAQKFIMKFDNFEKVKPFSFLLRV